MRLETGKSARFSEELQLISRSLFERQIRNLLLPPQLKMTSTRVLFESSVFRDGQI